MSEFLDKILILLNMLKTTFNEWLNYVWCKGLDSPHCCDGFPEDECGCGGVTTRDIYASQKNRAQIAAKEQARREHPSFYGMIEKNWLDEQLKEAVNNYRDWPEWKKACSRTAEYLSKKETEE